MIELHSAVDMLCFIQYVEENMMYIYIFIII